MKQYHPIFQICFTVTVVYILILTFRYLPIKNDKYHHAHVAVFSVGKNINYYHNSGNTLQMTF